MMLVQVQQALADVQRETMSAVQAKDLAHQQLQDLQQRVEADAASGTELASAHAQLAEVSWRRMRLFCSCLCSQSR